MIATLLTKFVALPAKLKAWLIVGSVTVALMTAGGTALYWKGHHAAALAAAPKIAAAVDTANVQTLNAQGAQDAARAAQAAQDAARAAYAVTAELSIQAAKAEDANAPLPSDRSTRLHDADRRLCERAPSLNGCQPAS